MAACLLTGTAACSSGDGGQAAPASNTVPTSSVVPSSRPSVTSSSDAPALGPGPGSPPPTTPQPPPPSSPAKVDSACPFLGVDDISAAVGGVVNAHAEETKPDKQPGITIYRCDYVPRVGSVRPHELFVAAVPGSGRLNSLLADWSEDCAAPGATIPGVDVPARYCQVRNPRTAGEVMLLVGKKAHGQARVAELFMEPIRVDVYTALAKLLAARL